MSCNGVANVLCPSQIDPIAQNLLSRYPLPNIGGGLLYNNYRPDIKIQDNTDQMDHRFDFNLSSRDQFFVRYSFSHQVLHNPPPFGPILDGSTTNLGYEHVAVLEQGVASETHFFNPNFSNEARFGYSYANERFLSVNATTDVGAATGLGGLPYGQPGFQLNGGLPNISISTLSGSARTSFLRPSNIRTSTSIWITCRMLSETTRSRLAFLSKAFAVTSCSLLTLSITTITTAITRVT